MTQILTHLEHVERGLKQLPEILPVTSEAVATATERIKACSKCHRKNILNRFYYFLLGGEWTPETLEKLGVVFGKEFQEAIKANQEKKFQESDLNKIPASKLLFLGPLSNQYTANNYPVQTISEKKYPAEASTNFPRPSCPQCVLKHLADAGVLMMEAFHGYPVHRAWAIGNLSQAEQECFSIDPAFAADIRQIRLRIMEDPTYSPDFNSLLEKAMTLAEPVPEIPEVTILTVTRDRHELFAMHERMLKQQTFRKFKWIVVDDGQKPVVPELPCTYVRREPDKSKKFTHKENLLAGLEKWREGILVFMEDDDFYPPEYLAETVKLAQSCTGLFGWKDPYYYWPVEKQRTVNQRDDLCITAVTGCHFRYREELIDMIKKCKTNFADVAIWHQFSDKTMLKYPHAIGPIGIKGISGNGFTKEHRRTFDDQKKNFEKWFRIQVGEELFEKYQQLTAEVISAKNKE